MGGLIEKVDAEKAVNIIKDWIENPFKDGVFEKVKEALWALEEANEGNQAMEALARDEY